MTSKSADLRAGAASDYLGAGVDSGWNARDTILSDQRVFVVLNLFSCLFLQRFGVMIGNSEFFFCFIIFVASAAWLMARQNGVLRPRVTLLYILVTILFTLSTLLSILIPPPFDISIFSWIGVLLFSAVFVLGPRKPPLDEFVLSTFLLFARIICVIGIVQYALQFVGISVFTLGIALPALKPILVEANYNTQGFVSWNSSIQRANGIVLLEPGAYSQLAAIAILIDLFIRRRLLFLPLYGLSYVLSFSGTGLLSLLMTLAISAALIPSQRKHVVIAVLAGLPLLVGFIFLFPVQADMLFGRLSEFSSKEKSGYLRFVAQIEYWRYFSDSWRMFLGWGPGTLERAPVFLDGSTSAAIKLFAEYGLIGLIVYATFLISAVWNRRYVMLSVMMLVIYQFGGGNLLSPPTLILMAMLCVWTTVPQAHGREGDARSAPR